MSKLRKIYYRLSFYQTAPLHITNGEGETTDSDLMKDKRGLPFIPGTSIAGVLRSMLAPDAARELFGDLDADSRLAVSDARLLRAVRPETLRFSKRDGVGLSDEGAAVPAAKYDFEIVELPENGDPYIAILEWDGEGEAPEELTKLLSQIACDGVSFGAKTNRGFGAMRVGVLWRGFEFPEDLDAWLEFDPFTAPPEEFAAFEPSDRVENGDWLRVEAEFEVAGSASVRVPTTSPERTLGQNTPNHAPLSNMAGEAVIPGTSWAGCFRHHMRNLAKELGSEDVLEEIDALFGASSGGERRIKKSGIYFSESAISGGRIYAVTRTAVDRFTSAPRNAALYTANLCQGGGGRLALRAREAELTPLTRQLLGAALLDLHLGLLTVGGESGVGRGRMRLTRLLVNGEDRTERLTEEVDCDEILG